MRGLPGLTRPNGAGPSVARGAMPGVSADFLPAGPAEHDAMAQAFLQGQAPKGPMVQPRGPMGAGPDFAGFESAFAEGASANAAARAAVGPGPQPTREPVEAMPPERAAALRPHLHSFITPAAPPPVAGQAPALGPAEARRIRDRATIMGRHVFAGAGVGAADARVHTLLTSLGIDQGSALRQTGQQANAARMEEAFREAAAVNQVNRGGAWANEYVAARPPPGQSGGWANEFAAARPPPAAVPVPVHEQWANEFSQQQATQQGAAAAAGRDVASADAAQTQRLMETMSRDADPRMRNSQFLQFVSKMSRGEVDFDAARGEQQTKGAGTSADWAQEFSAAGPSKARAQWPEAAGGDFAGEGWAGEFADEGAFRRRLAKGWSADTGGTAADWAEDFAGAQEAGAVGGETDELEESVMARRVKGWAEEFEAGANPLGETSVPDSFLEEYQEYMSELSGAAGEAADLSGRVGDYKFAERNPYVGRADALAVGRQLFSTGVLSEAVLALEAAVLAEPSNSEAWRLLGTVQAENDDDRQAIAAMARALRADPESREVLLSLGVSHTNELDSAEAANYLRRWLAASPNYSRLAPPEGAPLGEIVQAFERAAAQHPGDVDLHTVIGVLSNLTRDYDRAVGAFSRALELRPEDYSLWNKLGATQANSSRSSEALGAYQRALDAKPNYVRAWSNMGIALANMGSYEDSVRYYARALQMNPAADSVWGYVRISLSCAGRMDALAAVEARDLKGLLAMFPL